MAAVDFGYLEGYAAGDRTVVREVLQLFLQQANEWEAGLATPGDGWRDLAHSIKGTARSVGARELGDIAEAAEREGPAHAGRLQQALRAAVESVERYLAAD